jgi:hypothetical protein
MSLKAILYKYSIHSGLLVLRVVIDLQSDQLNISFILKSIYH